MSAPADSPATPPNARPPGAWPTITTAEWRWLVIAAALLLITIALPAALALLRSNTEWHYAGVSHGLDDGYSYLAKTRLGADGAWGFQNRYAIEAHRATPIYLFYILLGKFTGTAPGAVIVGYHLARLLSATAYFGVTYVLAAHFLAEVWQRRLAWLLIHLAGGFGLWLVLLTGDPLPFGNPPLDFYLNEALSFHVLLAVPHTVFARAALVAGLLLFVRAFETLQWPPALGAGLLWLLATIALPFAVLIAGGIVGGWLIFTWRRTRSLPWRAALLGLLAGLPGALWVLLNLVLIHGDAVYAAWNAQNSLTLPHPIHWLSTFGLPAALAVAGGWSLWRKRTPRNELLIGWAVVAPLLALIPVNFQFRLIEAWSLSLFILAVAGLPALLPQSRWQKIAGAALLLILLPTTAVLLLGASLQAFNRDETIFLPADAVAAYTWLDANAETDAILLCTEPVGLIAPARASIRVVLGHGFETPDFDTKAAAVAAFYRAPDPALLARYHVDYIWWGPHERALPASTDPGPALDLTPVFQQGDITLYAVPDS